MVQIGNAYFLSDGSGTAGVHWSEAVFGNELMTGYISGTPDPLSSLTIAALRDLGYSVIEATNGPQARKLLEGDAKIDLLFTDVVMPGGMTGRQVADAAKQRRPTLKILFTSGYTENSITHHGRLDTGVHFLSKPFRRQELALKVREALEA